MKYMGNEKRVLFKDTKCFASKRYLVKSQLWNSAENSLERRVTQEYKEQIIMKSKANKKKLKTDFAELFVKAASGYDPTDPHNIPDELDDYVDDVCNGGVPNALQSFEILVELVNDLGHTQTQANVMEALYDYDIWNIYEISLTDQELAFVQLKHGDFIEQIRRDEEEEDNLKCLQTILESL